METSIRNICNPNVVTLPPEASVAAAAALMREHHVGSVVILDAARNKPTGIVTDRDIVVEVVAKDVDPAKVAVGEIVQRPLVTVHDDASSTRAVRSMVTHGVRRLPVVDAQGTLVGIVSLDDLLADVVAPLVALGKFGARERRNEAATRGS